VILACSVALNAFLIFSPLGVKPVSALTCQQYCDSDAAACADNCDYLYTQYSDDWQSCQNSCYSDWRACSMNAETCTFWCATNGPDEWTCGLTSPLGCSQHGWCELTCLDNSCPG
jgi:hypothetical protein